MDGWKMKKSLSQNPSEEPQDKPLPENPPVSEDTGSIDSPAMQDEPAESSDAWPEDSAEEADEKIEKGLVLKEETVSLDSESSDGQNIEDPKSFSVDRTKAALTSFFTVVFPAFLRKTWNKTLVIVSKSRISLQKLFNRTRSRAPLTVDRIKTALLLFFTVMLPTFFRKTRRTILVVASESRNSLRLLFDQIKKGRSSQGKRKKPDKIKRTSRERVYKLRGYTTIEKVNAKRKAQRRFKLAQRVLITALCVSVLGYFAFKNNPFTDVDELLRIIGIRKTQSVLFHQFIFPVKMVEGDTPAGDLLPEEDIIQIVKKNGRANDLFHIMAFEDLDALKVTLSGSKRTLSDEDLLQLSRDRKIGTILLLVEVDESSRSYRFSEITQAGVVIDITATSFASAGGDAKVYVIGLLSSRPFTGYSYDVTIADVQTTMTTRRQ